MPTLALDGPLAWAILATPLIALGLVALRVLLATLWLDHRPVVRRREGLAPAQTPASAGASERPSPIRGADQPREGNGIDLEERAGPSSDVVPTAPATDNLAPVVPVEPAVPEPVPPDLEARIAQAEQNGSRSSLPSLYFERALGMRAAGDIRGAAGTLRRSIVLATELGQRQVHAQGRLELGDICESEGDLTTACEHWHMARDLFLGVRAATEAEAVKHRMETRGCPTDWVLTEF